MKLGTTMKLLATPCELTLHAETAADLMMANPVSIREDASVHDAIVLFTNKGFSAAPVIDSCSGVSLSTSHQRSPSGHGTPSRSSGVVFRRRPLRKRWQSQ